MSVLRLLLREVQYRKLNFVLGLVAVITAVALPVAVLTMCDAADRETKRLMRNMGFNLVIVPADVKMTDFWSQDFAKATMSEQYVHDLAKSPRLEIDHLVARLQRRIEWRGSKVLLTGLLPELTTGGKSKMIFEVPRGTVHVGFEAAKITDKEHPAPAAVGSKISLEGAGGRGQFRVGRILPEQGNLDDIRIYGHLGDVQGVLGTPGQISEIQALSCLCQGSDLTTLRADLAREFPETKISEFTSRALARAETRGMVEKYAAFLIPAVVLACALWVALLALSNVRERRTEIGLLRAMGVGSLPIGALFLGRAMLVGLVGAAIGFPLGTWAALHFGPGIFTLTASHIAPDLGLLPWALIGAPLLCAAAGYIPTIVAVTQDPAEVLKEE